jgi:tricorn protease-like protein
MIPVSISDDGSIILVSNSSYNGLAAIYTESGEIIKISGIKGTGYYPTISPDKKYVCYKSFIQGEGAMLQIPVLFDLENEKKIELSQADALAGTPAVAADGKIAYTI